MEYQHMKRKNIIINKDKSIGKVLFIVEGQKTEFQILRKIFTGIFDYQFEAMLRDKPYVKYKNKNNPLSSVFVINTEESNIKFIDEGEEYLNKLFAEIIDKYKFSVDNAAIFYIFDRDCHSNTNSELILSLLNRLRYSRDSNGDYMQGLLLLSYSCIESFTLSNFDDNSFKLKFDKGKDIKQYLHQKSYSHQRIDEHTLKRAIEQMELALKEVGIEEYDVDEFVDTNINIFDAQEDIYKVECKYNVLSLLCIALLDLGLISVEE